MQSMKQKGFGLSLFSVVLGVSLLAARPVSAQAQTLLVAYAGQKLFPSRRGKALCESKDQIIESLRLVNKERMPGCFENFDLSPRAILL